MSEPGQIKVKINERENVTALLYPAAKGDRLGVTALLGHGAGANQTSSFMRMAAAGLAARGIDALTFNFLYTEQGRKLPDPKARLESCYAAVIEAALNHAITSHGHTENPELRQQIRTLLKPLTS